MFRLVSVFVICGSHNFPVTSVALGVLLKVAGYPTASYVSDSPVLKFLGLLSLPAFPQFPALFIMWKLPL